MDPSRFPDHYLQARRIDSPARTQRCVKEVAMKTESNSEVHRWRAFAVLAVAYFMTIIDLTIVNVALPTIGRNLHFSESSLQWVVTAYGLTFGGFLLLGGRAADLLGRRRILMLGLAIFTLASVALAGVSQLLVTRISAGPVMAFGMALIGGGALLATQASVDGHFWSALA